VWYTSHVLYNRKLLATFTQPYRELTLLHHLQTNVKQVHCVTVKMVRRHCCQIDSTKRRLRFADVWNTVVRLKTSSFAICVKFQQDWLPGFTLWELKRMHIVGFLLNSFSHMPYAIFRLWRHCSIFSLLNILSNTKYCLMSMILKKLWKKEHLLLRSKCSISHNVFKCQPQ